MDTSFLGLFAVGVLVSLFCRSLFVVSLFCRSLFDVCSSLLTCLSYHRYRTKAQKIWASDSPGTNANIYTYLHIYIYI